MTWFAKLVCALALLAGQTSANSFSLIQRAQEAHGIEALRHLKTLRVVSQRIVTHLDGRTIVLGEDVMDYDLIRQRVRLSRYSGKRLEQVKEWDGKQLVSWELGDVETSFTSLWTRAAIFTGPLFLRNLESTRACSKAGSLMCTFHFETQGVVVKFQLDNNGLIQHQRLQVDGKWLEARFDSYKEIAGVQFAYSTVFCAADAIHEMRMLRITPNWAW
jgi:hypothetical protein